MTKLLAIAVGLIEAVIVGAVFFYAGVKQGRETENTRWKAWRDHFDSNTWYIDGAYYPEPKYLIPEECEL